MIENPPGVSTAASPFDVGLLWKEKALSISCVLCVPSVSGVLGAPGWLDCDAQTTLVSILNAKTRGFSSMFFVTLTRLLATSLEVNQTI